MRSRRLLTALAAAVLALASAAPAQAASGVSVYPSPGTKYNLPTSQITFRGIAASQIGQVQVVGSQTGAHAGTIQADSDGNGGSFLPTAPFNRGETVTVTTSLNIIGAPHGTFSFLIAKPAYAIKPMPLPVAPAGSTGLQHFHSRPDLLPPSVVIAKNAAPSGEGDIFLTPQYGPSQNGPMILSPSGQLIWFDPVAVSSKTLMSDLRVQSYQGQPVLTWWQGYTNHGSGQGEGFIFDDTYREIATVNAGNGLMMDLHEFLLTPQGTAWIIAVSPVYINGIGKPVMDAVIQEIDIPTGLVMYEWHALDHVPLTDSFFTTKTPGFVFDPYHMNSISPVAGGALVVSMRNTSTIYKVDEASGRILWELGGRHSSFRLGNGVSTAFQHDAIVQPDGTITIFDDGAGPPALHPSSRGIRVSLNTKNMTASLVREYDHSPGMSSDFEGNVQELSGGDVFMGWGQQPFFSEDNGAGQQILDGRFTSPTSSYRAYRFAWTGKPSTSPALAVSPAPDGSTDVYVSWNGANDVASWRVLAGATATSLSPQGSAGVGGFETTIPVHTADPYLAVQALGATGEVLGTTTTAQAPPHLGVFGRSAFVSGAGTGGVPAGCLSPNPCSVSTTVSAGGTVIARTGREAIGSGLGGVLFFNLSSAGRSMLARAPRGQLAATVTSRDASGMAASVPMTLIRFDTRGAGPARNVSQGTGLSLIGLTDFVSKAGTGGLLVDCTSLTPCLISAKLAVGGTTIATTGPEFVGAGELGYVIFSLTGTGRSLLARASGNQLGVTASLTNGSSTATGRLALVGF